MLIHCALARLDFTFDVAYPKFQLEALNQDGDGVVCINYVMVA